MATQEDYNEAVNKAFKSFGDSIKKLQTAQLKQLDENIRLTAKQQELQTRVRWLENEVDHLKNPNQ